MAIEPYPQIEFPETTPEITVVKRGVSEAFTTWTTFDEDADEFKERHVAQQYARNVQAEMDAAPVKGRIEYVGGFQPFAIYITQHVMGDGPVFAFTWKGAKRKMDRLIRRRERHQAKVLGYREVQETDAERFDAMMKGRTT